METQLPWQRWQRVGAVAACDRRPGLLPSMAKGEEPCPGSARSPGQQWLPEASHYGNDTWNDTWKRLPSSLGRRWAGPCKLPPLGPAGLTLGYSAGYSAGCSQASALFKKLPLHSKTVVKQCCNLNTLPPKQSR